MRLFELNLSPFIGEFFDIVFDFKLFPRGYVIEFCTQQNNISISYVY